VTKGRGTCRERFTVIHIAMSKRKVNKPDNKLLGYHAMNHGGDRRDESCVHASRMQDRFAWWALFAKYGMSRPIVRACALRINCKSNSPSSGT